MQVLTEGGLSKASLANAIQKAHGRGYGWSKNPRHINPLMTISALERKGMIWMNESKMYMLSPRGLSVATRYQEK